MKKKKVFTPLNISYPIQKYSNSLVVGGLLGLVVIAVGLIITIKIKNDLAFSPIFGTPIFSFVGVALTIYAGVFVFRKLGLREGEQMRLYREMLDHELTTINDLWEIIAIDENVATFADDSSKIFLRCEKGYLISRPGTHFETHQVNVQHFLKHLLDKGYYVDYYNMRNRDANTEPLVSLEEDLNSNPNSFLRDYGNSVIKFCRELEYQCTESEIEYYVITSRDPNLSVYLESSVETAVEYLQGSLYTDVQICDVNGIVDFLELFNKISGINVTDMLAGNVVKTDQMVVKVLKVLGANSNKTSTGTMTSEEQEEYDQFLEEYNAFEQSMQDAKKRKKKKNANMVKQSSKSPLKPVPIDAGNNIVAPIDMTKAVPVMPSPVIDDEDEILDDDEVIKDINDDDEILDDEVIENDDNEIIDDEVIEKDDEDIYDIDFDELIGNTSNESDYKEVNKNDNHEILDEDVDDIDNSDSYDSDDDEDDIYDIDFDELYDENNSK